MRRWKLILALSLAFNALTLGPLAASSWLRSCYQQVLAKWHAKFVRPSVVFIGDSLTAGGGTFGHLDAINLGSNGITTRHIVQGLYNAQKFNPEQIVVMAGMNDAIAKTANDELVQEWKSLVADPRVTIVLVPHSRYADRNREIDRINAIAAAAGKRANRPVISLDELQGKDGLIQPRYTIDGTHLTPAGYAVWLAKLNR